MKLAEFSSSVRPLIARAQTILSEIPDGEILTTLSGGADSVALLRLLLLFKRSVTAIHCNFHLRGEESNRDADFVQKLCNSLDVPIIRVDFDTNDYILNHPGTSVEMACRQLRHSRFDVEAKRLGCIRIATGHNASDNAETLMLNILRGSGISGLKGMLPDDGRIVRPLIESSRSEILSFLEDLNQDFVTDSTNNESDYQRNFLRNNIFPLIAGRWEGMNKSFLRTIRLLQRQHKILEHFLSKTLEGTTNFLEFSTIDSFPESVTLIHRFIQSFRGSTEIAEEISRSIKGNITGKRWNLPNHIVVAERDGLRIIEHRKSFTAPELIWERFEINDGNRSKIKKMIFSSTDNSEGWFPECSSNYELRSPLKGEHFRPLGMKGSRLCSDIIAEAHLPADLRENYHLLALKSRGKTTGKNQGEAVWMPGLKRARLSLIDIHNATECYRCTLKPIIKY